jgi:hypothetical protein
VEILTASTADVNTCVDDDDPPRFSHRLLMPVADQGPAVTMAVGRAIAETEKAFDARRRIDARYPDHGEPRAPLPPVPADPTA